MNNSEIRHKIIYHWLLLGVIMLVVQIALGGITRLTGSGLSMTQWGLILDAIPPMSESAWQAAFDNYKEIGQFKFLNADFTLADFKSIYFWEWLHREWGMLIGFVFFLPFVYFLVKKMVPQPFIFKFIILLLLGASQGLIGWIMVASGLNDSNLYVDHFKLALHFVSALFLISITFWYALEYNYPNELSVSVTKRQRQLLVAIVVLLGIQMTYGAFMAGLKAAQAAPTWPLINGDWVPVSLWTKSMFSHSISVHFIHRGLGYLLFFLILFWTLRMRSATKNKAILLPFIFVILQIMLGIFSVLYAPMAVKNGWGIFEWNAQLHQLVAMSLLLSLVYFLFVFRHKTK